MNRENNSSEKISIIIPVYNSAKYIETTLRDLFAQTYQNFEIIIAYDEKTTDNTLEILQRLNKIHPLLIDIGKDTSAGSARNRGLKHANGDYVIFVDADDGILPDYLEKLHDLLVLNDTVDVACCDYLKVTDNNINNKRLSAEKSDTSSYTISMKEALKLFVEGEILGVPWIYMVRRNLLIENNIMFPDYSYGEDTVYAVHILEKARMVGICRKKLYLFRQQASSLTHTLPDRWWNKFDESQKEVTNVLQKYYPESVNTYNLGIAKWVVADSVKRYSNYNEFEGVVSAVMKEYGVTKLPLSLEKNSRFRRAALVCFNKSWRLYYVLSKIYYAVNKPVA